MGYMKEWRGKTDKADKSGEADYMVDGELFTIPLPTFKHATRLDDLLFAAFKQGKTFAFEVLNSRIDQAIHSADIAHDLSSECRKRWRAEP